MIESPPLRLPVAVDVMGGDHAPAAVVAGAMQAYLDGLPVVLVGDAERVRALLRGSDLPPVVHAPYAVSMGDPATSVKRHDDASVRRAAQLVAKGSASSVVSFGNSGAALVASVLELGVLEGVSRPGIALTVPRADGGSLVLIDAGASVDCRPDHLLTWALLGEAYAHVLGVDAPRVGLLSNGAEAGKGPRVVKEAFPLLTEACGLFVGNVEPEAALGGACDVLVCDGFSGNVFLKTAEGLVSLLGERVRRGVRSSWRARLGAWLLRPVFDELRAELDWRSRGGALLLGVPAPVVVGHGRADARAVRAAIGLAHYASQRRLIDRVTEALVAGAARVDAASVRGEHG